MLIGVPKETKDHEYRVGLIPATVRELVRAGHRVLVQRAAGVGAEIGDDAYLQAGAEIAPNADEVFAKAEMIVKVKEPLAEERAKLRRGQILFTYLHLAADRAQAEDLLASGVTAIAYETVTRRDGSLPLLTPMSEVAGRMATQVGAHCLEKANGGRGMLLGGVPGVPPADVADARRRRGRHQRGADRARHGRHRDRRRRISWKRSAALSAQLGPRLRTVFSYRKRSRRSAAAPTSSSARCWSPAARRRSSSPPRRSRR